MIQSVDVLQVPDAHVRIELVEQLFGVERTTIHRWVKRGHFPPPLKLGQRYAYWPARVINEQLSANA